MTGEEDSVLVCVRVIAGEPLILPDNKLGTCSACGWRVQHAPDAPPIRQLCIECAMDRIKPGDTVHLTPYQLARVQEYYRKRKQ